MGGRWTEKLSARGNRDGQQFNYSEGLMKPTGALVLVFAVPVLLSSGCQRKAQFSVPGNQGRANVADASKDEPRAQVRVGAGDPNEWGLLAFDILKMYPKRKPTDALPGHAEG